MAQDAGSTGETRRHAALRRGRRAAPAAPRGPDDTIAALRRELRDEIEGRLAAEAAGQRLRRALRVHGKCHRIVFGATSEIALVEQVCQAIVALGDYALAWVGYAQDDAEQSIRPVAKAGDDAGYVDSVQASWRDAGRGSGPAGTAVRTGSIVVIRDTAADPRFALWRRTAAERGYLSCAAIPLRDATRSFGVLLVYAGVADAFDASETALLGELGDDLAFGIATLRDRAARDAAEAEVRRLTQLVDVALGLPVVLSRIDRDGVVTELRGGGLARVGDAAERMRGASIYALMPYARGAIDAALAGGTVAFTSGDEEYRESRGTRASWFFQHAFTFDTASGSGAVGFAIDVTERRLAEMQSATAALRHREALVQMITVMGRTIERRDPYTAGHQQRVAALAVAIARALRLPEEQVEGLRLGGLIHDVGKMYVPAEILAKPARLSDAERALVKGHCEMGASILDGIDLPWPIRSMVLQHHERLDGSGYPKGLKGDEIAIEARILAVADTVEAMASHRPYRAALGIDAALAEIMRNRGVLYEGAAVDACVKVIREDGFDLHCNAAA